jgi:hypothetical protein
MCVTAATNSDQITVATDQITVARAHLFQQHHPRPPQPTGGGAVTRKPALAAAG